VVRELIGGLVVGDDTATEDASTTAPQSVGPDVGELFGQDRSLAIAHAGGERDHPKETPFAFGESARVGVDVLELDVHLSADGQIVVTHDDTVDGTTDSTGKVADLTAAELADLDAAYWFVPGCSVSSVPGPRRRSTRL
jgi:glycerophosphoryl diester phosphodiesterase